MGWRTNAILITPEWPGTARDLLACLGVDARPSTRERLVDAWHPAHLSVGRLGGCTLVLDHLLLDLLIHREEGLERELASTLSGHRVLGLHVDDDLGSYGWVYWEHGERIRTRIGSARDGIRIDEGAWLEEERRWPVLMEPSGMRWVDGQGRSWNHARMGVRCVRWLSARLLGAPLDRHPDLAHAKVQRFVERPTESDMPAAPAAPGDREPMPRWLRRLLNR